MSYFKMNTALYTLILLFGMSSCKHESDKIDMHIRKTDLSSFISRLENDITSNKQIMWDREEDSIFTFKSTTTPSLFKEKLDWFYAKRDTLKKISFFFENSASMNGYIDDPEFRQNIYRIYTALPEENTQGFFANTQLYPQDNIIERFKKGDIKTKGTGNTDHQYIFKEAIKRAANNGLSILVTDGIYSPKSGDNNLDLIAIDIAKDFKEALSNESIETVVLKMESNYTGIYYGQKCKKRTKIDQKRPYYIFLFGNKYSINKALKQYIVLKELKGYVAQNRFVTTSGLYTPYTILTKGDEMIGSFKTVEKGYNQKHAIEDLEKESSKFKGTPNDAIQFAVAIDLSKVNLPKSYILDASNYKISGKTDFEIQNILAVQDLKKNSKTLKAIELLSKENIKPDYLIVLRGHKELFGNINVELIRNLPQWILETGTMDDCNIEGDTNTTYAFDQLMYGIEEAYKKISKEQSITNIKLTTNL